MATAADLTTLAQAKAWLNITDTSSDALIATLITAASRFIMTYTNRSSFLPTASTRYYDGTMTYSILLRDFPVISVSAVTVNGVAVQASSTYPTGYGYFLEPADSEPPGSTQRLLFGGCGWWTRGKANIAVTCTTGYQVTAEAQTVPANPYQITATQPYGAWGADAGVTYATGAALTKVATAPAQGQYSVSNGVYTFAATDAGASVLLSYGYIPADLAQACFELVGEKYRMRDRIGIVSKTLGGQETISYSQRDMHPTIKILLQQYMRVVPA